MMTLERICKTIGHSQTIRVDQKSEFTSRDLDARSSSPPPGKFQHWLA